MKVCSEIVFLIISTKNTCDNSGMSDSIFQKQQPEKLLHVRDSIIGSTASVLLLYKTKEADLGKLFGSKKQFIKTHFKFLVYYLLNIRIKLDLMGPLRNKRILENPIQ